MSVVAGFGNDVETMLGTEDMDDSGVAKGNAVQVQTAETTFPSPIEGIEYLVLLAIFRGSDGEHGGLPEGEWSLFRPESLSHTWSVLSIV
jgi:hypothetical protein